MVESADENDVYVEDTQVIGEEEVILIFKVLIRSLDRGSQSHNRKVAPSCQHTIPQGISNNRLPFPLLPVL